MRGLAAALLLLAGAIAACGYQLVDYARPESGCAQGRAADAAQRFVRAGRRAAGRRRAAARVPAPRRLPADGRSRDRRSGGVGQRASDPDQQHQLLVGGARARVPGEPRARAARQARGRQRRSRSIRARCARPSATWRAPTWAPCTGTARRRCAGWRACSPRAYTTRCSRWRRLDAGGAARSRWPRARLRPPT